MMLAYIVQKEFRHAIVRSGVGFSMGHSKVNVSVTAHPPTHPLALVMANNVRNFVSTIGRNWRAWMMCSNIDVPYSSTVPVLLTGLQFTGGRGRGRRRGWWFLRAICDARHGWGKYCRLMLLARDLLYLKGQLYYSSTCKVFAIHERSSSHFMETLFTFLFSLFFSAMRVVVTITSTVLWEREIEPSKVKEEKKGKKKNKYCLTFSTSKPHGMG